MLKITYESFEKLRKHKDIVAGVTHRHGGVSKGGFGSLNLNIHIPNDEKNAFMNLDKFVDSLGENFEAIFATKQVHSKKVQVLKNLDEYDKGLNIIDGKDAVITNLPRVLLMTFYADCVPVLLYDQRKKVIGACHSGWKGTELMISAEVISKMISEFGCDPADITAAIGPSAHKCCYKVGNEVYNAFPWCKDCFREVSVGQYMMDIKEINKRILLNAGISKENIEISPKCTICGREEFFSFRRDGEESGRMSGFIYLK